MMQYIRVVAMINLILGTLLVWMKYYVVSNREFKCRITAWHLGLHQEKPLIETLLYGVRRELEILFGSAMPGGYFLLAGGALLGVVRLLK